MTPVIQSTTQITAQEEINPIDCVVLVTETTPAADCIWAPNSLYRGSTASKIRKASKDDLDCTTIQKKSGETIKKHTGMSTILKNMVSHSMCLRLDDSFLRQS
jgi:hypothetical protein